MERESPEDFFRGRGIEPSKVKMDAQYESPEEMISRLAREEADNNARLEKEKLDNIQKRKVDFTKFVVKEISVYTIGILLIIVLTSTSTLILFNKTSSQEERSWARSTLTAIATAVVGYVFGKSSSS